MAVNVREIVRLDNWWCAKIPPLLAVAYVSILLGGIDLGRAAVLLGCFLFSVACVAAYGHVVNDLLPASAAAGRPCSPSASSPPASCRGCSWATPRRP
jgi:hypothetical protein